MFAFCHLRFWDERMKTNVRLILIIMSLLVSSVLPPRGFFLPWSLYFLSSSLSPGFFFAFLFCSCSPLFFFSAVPRFSFLQSPSWGCLYLGFYRAGIWISAVTGDSNGVGRSIQWRNVPAFNGGAAVEEENEWTVACTKWLRFPISKAAFSLVLRILVILQSSPWLKYNWILAFPRHFQASPWILIFAIWTPIKPQALVFLQLSPWFH